MNAAAADARAAEFENLKPEGGAQTNRDVNMDVILDVPVTLSMEVGRTRIPIRNLLQLNQGSVIELDRAAGEPLDVFVNGTLVCLLYTSSPACGTACTCATDTARRGNPRDDGAHCGGARRNACGGNSAQRDPACSRRARADDPDAADCHACCRSIDERGAEPHHGCGRQDIRHAVERRQIRQTDEPRTAR